MIMHERDLGGKEPRGPTVDKRHKFMQTELMLLVGGVLLRVRE